jgi:glutamate-1-semialdehyde 2,1-aminomutase
MDMIAPLGPVYQAGTLSGNPLAMAAGIATLNHLCDKDDVYEKLEFNANMLVEGIAEAASDVGVKLTYNRVGSMFTWFFRKKDGNVWDWTSASESDTERFGIYLPPSQYEAAFLSTAHSVDDIEQTIEAARTAFKAF